MRLFPHLVISHSVPVIVVTLALALLVTALVRISMVLTTLSESELDVLQEEGEIHRSAWALDVAMRHGQSACAEGTPSREVATRIGPRKAALRALLGLDQAKGGATLEGASRPMRDVAEGYLAITAQILAGDTCEGLLGASLQRRRAELDEQLTNVWVARMAELHVAVADKDAEARAVAVSATWAGVPLAAIAFLLAMLIARRMARIINRPLGTLAAMAKRVGEGDFHTSVTVAGPAEILSLAEELERMRVQLQQLEQLKQGFLASVSHELRTPLSKIREALALLQDGAVGEFHPKQMRVIQIARKACEREIRMVTTLLDVSRLRAGNHIRMHSGVAIDRVLQNALHDEEQEASSRDVALVLMSEGGPATCRLDPILVERAVANLIRNAVNVSDRGQRVEVLRTLEQGESGQRWVCVKVTDQGPGVPREVREQLFDPFVTRAVPRTTKTQGVGLGLALAREVVQAHGGQIALLESGDHGTTFELRLPADPPSGAEGKVERPNSAQSAGVMAAALWSDGVGAWHDKPHT